MQTWRAAPLQASAAGGAGAGSGWRNGGVQLALCRLALCSYVWPGLPFFAWRWTSSCTGPMTDAFPPPAAGEGEPRDDVMRAAAPKRRKRVGTGGGARVKGGSSVKVKGKGKAGKAAAAAAAGGGRSGMALD